MSASQDRVRKVQKEVAATLLSHGLHFLILTLFCTLGWPLKGFCQNICFFCVGDLNLLCHTLRSFHFQPYHQREATCFFVTPHW